VRAHVCVMAAHVCAINEAGSEADPVDGLLIAALPPSPSPPPTPAGCCVSTLSWSSLLLWLTSS
jgi:hypothetical protein